MQTRDMLQSEVENYFSGKKDKAEKERRYIQIENDAKRHSQHNHEVAFQLRLLVSLSVQIR